MINLNFGKYKIKTMDDKNIVLIEVKTVKDEESKRAGETYEITKGYYSSIDDALNGYIKARINDPDVELTSLKAVLDYIAFIRGTIDDVFQRAYKGVK